MKFKKYLLFLVVATLAVVAVACGTNGNENETENNQVEETNNNEEANNAGADNENSNDNEASNLEGTITSAGSTSVQPLSEELAAAFMEIHPNTRVEVAGGGSGAGVTAAQEGTADFGGVSREIREDETGIIHEVIAIDGIAIIAHPDNPVADIPLEDVTKIFTGEITNWSEVGGEDLDIVVVSREDGSGTRGAFTDIVLGDEELVASALIHNSTGGVLEAVANDEYAIGYASTGSMTDAVKGLAVDGFEPTDENIIAGDYKVSRPFNYAMNEDEELSEVAQAFLDFIFSDEGKEVVAASGFIPVN